MNNVVNICLDQKGQLKETCPFDQNIRNGCHEFCR